MPVIMELRIRACHVRGSSVPKTTSRRPCRQPGSLAEPAPFDYASLSHPPVTFAQESDKTDGGMPAARAFIARTA